MNYYTKCNRVSTSKILSTLVAVVCKTQIAVPKAANYNIFNCNGCCVKLDCIDTLIARPVVTHSDCIKLDLHSHRRQSTLKSINGCWGNPTREATAGGVNYGKIDRNWSLVVL